MRKSPKRNAEWREAKRATNPQPDDAEPPSGHRGVDPAVYAAVVARDQGCTGRWLIGGQCWGRLDPHHVWRAGQGASDEPDALVLLCRAHHGWVHAHVAWSIEHGFLSHSWDGIEGARAAAALRRASWP